MNYKLKHFNSLCPESLGSCIEEFSQEHKINICFISTWYDVDEKLHRALLTYTNKEFIM